MKARKMQDGAAQPEPPRKPAFLTEPAFPFALAEVEAAMDLFIGKAPLHDDREVWAASEATRYLHRRRIAAMQALENYRLQRAQYAKANESWDAIEPLETEWASRKMEKRTFSEAAKKITGLSKPADAKKKLRWWVKWFVAKRLRPRPSVVEAGLDPIRAARAEQAAIEAEVERQWQGLCAAEWTPEMVGTLRGHFLAEREKVARFAEENSGAQGGREAQKRTKGGGTKRKADPRKGKALPPADGIEFFRSLPSRLGLA